MRKTLMTLAVILALFLGMGVMTGCDKSKSASDNVSDAVQRGGEAVGDAAQTAGDAVKDALD